MGRYTLPDGDNAGERPLADLATRASDDPSIALLDAAAVVADVLTFYQERIANEGFLRTATERRSVLEMARAIGYELNPGVAATAYLTFTVEDAEGAPGKSDVPAGTQVMSIPPQGQLPQTFETADDITARKQWNAIKVQAGCASGAFHLQPAGLSRRYIDQPPARRPRPASNGHQRRKPGTCPCPENGSGYRTKITLSHTCR